VLKLKYKKNLGLITYTVVERPDKVCVYDCGQPWLTLTRHDVSWTANSGDFNWYNIKKMARLIAAFNCRKNVCLTEAEEGFIF
jgi:hypothetical protein